MICAEKFIHLFNALLSNVLWRFSRDRLAGNGFGDLQRQIKLDQGIVV